MDDVVFPTGSLISEPREDGAIQHIDWNHHLDSNPHPFWANRWMFLQDTLARFLGALTQKQLINNRYNLGVARLMAGMSVPDFSPLSAASTLGWTWTPFDESNGDLLRVPIEDAIAFTSDWAVPSGDFKGEISVGTWAKDIPLLIPEWVKRGYWLNQNPPGRPYPVNTGLSFVAVLPVLPEPTVQPTNGK